MTRNGSSDFLLIKFWTALFWNWALDMAGTPAAKLLRQQACGTLELILKKLQQLIVMMPMLLIGIVFGGLLGYVRPEWGVQLRPLGDAFVGLYCV